MRLQSPAWPILASLPLLLGSPALADPHPMALGGLAGPKAPPVEIGMRNEKLDIQVGLDHADVTADIELANTGPARELPVGFPCERGEDAGMMLLDCKTPITVTVDGKRLRTKVQSAGGKKEYVFRLKLAEGQLARVVIKYKAKLVNERYDVPMDGCAGLLYRLTTGAEWSGPIGKLDMTVTLPGDAVAYARPLGYVRTARRIEWHLTDYEPKDELVIFFVPGMSGLLSSTEAWSKKGKAPSPEQLRAWHKDAVARIGRGDLAAEVVEFARMLASHSQLPAPPDLDEVRKTMAESARLLDAEIAP